MFAAALAHGLSILTKINFKSLNEKNVQTVMGTAVQTDFKQLAKGF